MKWKIFDRFYDAHWFLTGYSCRNFINLLRIAKVKNPKFIAIMEKDINLMIFDSEQFDQAGRYWANKMVEDKIWRNKMYRQHDLAMKKFFAAGEKLRSLKFDKLSESLLIKEIRKMLPLQEQVRILGVMLNGLILDGENHFSNKLKEKLSLASADEKMIEQCWPKLTQSTNMSCRQKKDLEIAVLAQKIKSGAVKNYEPKLKMIYNTFCWLDYMYYGPESSYEDYRKELKDAIKNNINFDLKTRLKKLKQNQLGLMKRLKFSKAARELFGLAQFMLEQKSWRKDVEYHGFYCYQTFFQEIARRKKVKDWRDLFYLLPWEIENFILKNEPSAKVLKERRIFSCLVSTETKAIKLFSGVQARQLFAKLKIKSEMNKSAEIVGQCAYPGQAVGKVRIIQVKEDMAKMKKGNILISQATSPDLLPAMKKASAVVTATGGLICHAAITCRELQIPCVVGTGNANIIFKDGDLVSVDANKGIVRKI